MFLVNVPVDATERELVLFFKWAGMVEKVVFDLDKETGEVGREESDDDEGDVEMKEVEGGDSDESDDSEADASTTRKKSKHQKPQAPTTTPLPTTDLRTLRTTGGTAYLIFLEPSSLTRALKPSPTPRPWPHMPSDAPSGLAHFKALYLSLRPPLDAVRAHADSALVVYDYEQEQKKRRSEYKKGEAIVDEDGFTLVTRGGAYGKTVGGGVGVARKGWGEGEERKRRKKKGESKEGMYAFQKHEKNRKREFGVFLDIILC